jgi:hypothetical protein
MGHQHLPERRRVLGHRIPVAAAFGSVRQPVCVLQRVIPTVGRRHGEFGHDNLSVDCQAESASLSNGSVTVVSSGRVGQNDFRRGPQTPTSFLNRSRLANC